MSPLEMRIYNRLPSLVRGLFLAGLDARDIIALCLNRRRHW